jgi:hypothetical protein
MPHRRWRVPLLLLPLSAVASCAAPEPPAHPVLSVPVVAAGELPPVPVCRDEMRAYVELTKLAKLHGDGWQVFSPAVDALKQQIIDCMTAVLPAQEQL